MNSSSPMGCTHRLSAVERAAFQSAALPGAGAAVVAT